MTRKYRNTPIDIDGIRFDSKREGNHYLMLKVLERAGKIADLAIHVRYPLEVNGTVVAHIEPDFQYVDCETGQLKIEDTKGTITRDWKLKAKMFEAQYGRKIEVIR